MWIEPKGFEETHARGNTAAHRLQDPAKWVPFGVGAIEGQAGKSLPVLEAGSGNGSSSAGDEPKARPLDEPDARPENELDARRAEEPPARSGDAPEAKPTYGPGEEPRPREGEPTGAAHGELL
jgi:hypothetical protein